MHGLDRRLSLLALGFLMVLAAAVMLSSQSQTDRETRQYAPRYSSDSVHVCICGLYRQAATVEPDSAVSARAGLRVTARGACHGLFACVMMDSPGSYSIHAECCHKPIQHMYAFHVCYKSYSVVSRQLEQMLNSRCWPTPPEYI